MASSAPYSPPASAIATGTSGDQPSTSPGDERDETRPLRRARSAPGTSRSTRDAARAATTERGMRRCRGPSLDACLPARSVCMSSPPRAPSRGRRRSSVATADPEPLEPRAKHLAVRAARAGTRGAPTSDAPRLDERHGVDLDDGDVEALRARRSSSAATNRGSTQGRQRDDERLRREDPRREEVDVAPRVRRLDARLEHRLDQPVALCRHPYPAGASGGSPPKPTSPTRSRRSR